MSLVSNPIILVDIRGLKFDLGQFFFIVPSSLFCDRKLSFITCEMGGVISSDAHK